MRFALAIIILFTISLDLYSQGYCSLREPQSKIKTFFPHYTNYKTIVSTVDKSTKKRLNEIVPFKLYHYDIGRHNIYSINSKKGPLGIVYARSEQSSYGLIEIAWALNYDLTILDFDFQRCRSTKKAIAKDVEFRKLIVGKNFYQLCKYIGTDGALLETVKIDNKYKELAQLIFQSAIKTVALTQISWKNFIEDVKNSKRAEVNLVKYVKGTELLNEVRFYQKNETWIKASFKSVPGIELEAKLSDGEIKELYIPIHQNLKGLNIENLKEELLKIHFKK